MTVKYGNRPTESEDAMDEMDDRVRNFERALGFPTIDDTRRLSASFLERYRETGDPMFLVYVGQVRRAERDLGLIPVVPRGSEREAAKRR